MTTSLDLLAAHMVGDYVTQTPHMAMNKLTDAKVRAKHVTAYTAGFVPPALASKASPSRKALFLAAVWATHFVTDSKRWIENEDWPPGTILADQALHAVQLAVLHRLIK